MEGLKREVSIIDRRERYDKKLIMHIIARGESTDVSIFRMNELSARCGKKRLYSITDAVIKKLTGISIKR